MTAHRKSSKYETTLNEVFGKLRGSAAIQSLLESALLMLASLDEWVAAKRVAQNVMNEANAQ